LSRACEGSIPNNRPRVEDRTAESRESTRYASSLNNSCGHRAALVVAGLGTTLLLAGCGNQTITASQAVSGQSIAIVVTSDSTGIASVESRVKAASPGVTIANGDTHTGAHVCGFNVSKNGHTYQVDVYGAIPSTICSAQARASFLQTAP
jgi:hypothetical protein